MLLFVRYLVKIKEKDMSIPVHDSTVLTNKRIAHMGSNGLFLTCEENEDLFFVYWYI
jgi:hypothetical protein